MKVPCLFLWYSGSSFSESFLYLSSFHSFWETFPTHSPRTSQDFPSGPLVKNPLANAADIGDADSIPGSRRSPEVGHGNLLQDSCLENSTDRGVWWAAVHGVANSRTQLSDWAGMHAHAMEFYSAKGFHIHKQQITRRCSGKITYLKNITKDALMMKNIIKDAPRSEFNKKCATEGCKRVLD